MAIKGFDFYLTDSGTQEAWQNSGGKDSKDAPEYIVFCDGVSPADIETPSTSSQAAATLAEQAIRHYLDKAENGQLTEESIHRAFAYANRRVLELYGDDENSVAVSAILMATIRDQQVETAEATERLLVAGVGDSVVYAVQAGSSYSAQTLFTDPQTPHVDHTMSTEERCLSLHNALGVGDQVQLHVRYYEPAAFERYLIASYGFERLYSTSEVAQMALRPHDAEKGVVAMLTQRDIGPHSVRTCAASYEASVQPLLEPEAEPQPATVQPIGETNPRRRESILALALSVVTCALVVFVAMEIVEDQQDSQSFVQSEQALPTDLPTPLAAVEEENSERLTTLQDTVAKQNEKIQALLTDLEDEKQLSAELTAKLEEAVIIDDSALNSLKAELQTEQQRAADLKAQLDAAAKNYQPIPKDAAGQARVIADLQEEQRDTLMRMRTLQSEVHRLTNVIAQKDELIEKTKAMSLTYANRYEELEARFANSMDEFSNSFAQQKERHTAELAKIESQAEEIRGELAKARKQNQMLTADLQQLMEGGTSDEQSIAAQKKLSAELASLKNALINEQKRNSVLKEELGSALSRLESTKKTSTVDAELKEELSKLKGDFSTLLEEKEKLDQQLLTMTAELNRRPDPAVVERETEERLSSLQTQLSQVRQNNQVLKEELEEALANLQTAKTQAPKISPEHAQRMENLSNALREKEKQTVLLKAEIEKLLAQNATHDDKVLAIQNEREALGSRIEMLEDERLKLLDDKASLMDKVTAMERFQELYTTEKQLRLNKEREFEEFAENIREQQEKLANVQSSREEMQREIARLRTEHEKLREEQAKAARKAIPEQFSGQALASGDEPLAGDSATRVHIVTRGDTLSGIAKRYLGSPSRWSDVYEANTNRIADPRRLKVGQALVIPQY